MRIRLILFHLEFWSGIFNFLHKTKFIINNMLYAISRKIQSWENIYTDETGMTTTTTSNFDKKKYYFVPKDRR